jgi:hypothetical protein
MLEEDKSIKSVPTHDPREGAETTRAASRDGSLFFPFFFAVVVYLD